MRTDAKSLREAGQRLDKQLLQKQTVQHFRRLEGESNRDCIARTHEHIQLWFGCTSYLRKKALAFPPVNASKLVWEQHDAELQEIRDLIADLEKSYPIIKIYADFMRWRRRLYGGPIDALLHEMAGRKRRRG